MTLQSNLIKQLTQISNATTSAAPFENEDASPEDRISEGGMAGGGNIQNENSSLFQPRVENFRTQKDETNTEDAAQQNTFSIEETCTLILSVEIFKHIKTPIAYLTVKMWTTQKTHYLVR